LQNQNGLNLNILALSQYKVDADILLVLTTIRFILSEVASNLTVKDKLENVLIKS